MTQSILQYDITAWDRLGIVANNKLLSAQKSIIKLIIHKPKTFSSENLFKDFRFLVYYNYFIEIYYSVFTN